MPIGKNPNGMSQLDEAQIIKRVYDEPNDQLRVTIDASVNVAGQQTLVITDVEDSIKIGDGSGNFVGVTGGGLNVNVTGITGSSIVDVQKFGGTAVSTGTGASGSGIPRVTVSNDSNILATQSGTWSVTANAGTNLNTSALALDASVNGILVSQGSTTSGEKGPLIQGAVTTTPPSYNNTQTSPLSLTTSGALRTDASATTQPVSGTVAVTQSTSPWVDNITQFGGTNLSTGTGNSGAGIPRVTISNDSSLTNISGTISLPTGASTAALQTSGNTSLTTIATNTTLLAQGSTTSGQTGNLSMGAVTTSAPTYITGKTNPLSLNTAGGLRVDGSGVTQPISAVSLPLPTGAATAANQAIEITNLQTINSLTPSTYDYISLGYTGSDLTTVIYKTGGSGGTTVSTLTLAYSSSVLQSVTRT